MWKKVVPKKVLPKAPECFAYAGTNPVNQSFVEILKMRKTFQFNFEKKKKQKNRIYTEGMTRN